jgi:hypothetical protein
MMSYTASIAWSHPVSSPCYTEHGQHYGVVLSGRITTVVMSRSGQLGRGYTIEPNCSGMSARLAGTSVTHKCALKTYEPSYVPGAARPFFIHVVHIPLGVVGYVAASELSSQGGRARSHGTRGSARAHLDREARSRAEEYVAAPEFNSVRRRGPGPWDTWQHWNPPQQECEVRGYRTRGSTRAHLGREVRSRAEEHMVASELNSARR